jgi:type I restriction enzyme S subunit
MPIINAFEKDEIKLKEILLNFPESLKKSILLAAIQGKLTEQMPSEEQASREHKNIEIIDKDSIDNLFFEIPDNWAWTTLKEIANIDGGFAFKSTQYLLSGTRVLRISDFNSKGLVENNKVYYSYEPHLSKYLVRDFDIVVCMTGGTVGKNYMFDKIREPLLLNQRVARIYTKSRMVLQKYIYFVINSNYIQNKIKSIKNSTNDNISMKDIQNFLIPIPPISEQKRIIDKINLLLPIISELEKNTTHLE